MLSEPRFYDDGVMKIKVSFTIDIDPEAWQDEYGTALGKIRDDVKEYAAQMVTDHFWTIGVIRETKLGGRA